MRRSGAVLHGVGQDGRQCLPRNWTVAAPVPRHPMPTPRRAGDKDVSKPKQQDPSQASAPPEMTLEEMTRLAALGPGDAVRMQCRAEEGRQAVTRMKADGDRVGALLVGHEADKLEQDAALALDPVLHTTGRVAVGNGGEIAISTKAMAPFVDMVRTHPDMLVIDASRQRMDLASSAGALSMALEASATITAGNSLEKMLMHEAAAAHVVAMEFQAEARDVLRAYKRTGYNHPNLSTEATRLLNASARMMDTYQRALLTLDRMRNGGKQTVVVQHVTVAGGGQAVVAGQIEARPKRRRRGVASDGG